MEEHQGHAPAGDAECGDRTEAENQERRNGNKEEHADADDHGWKQHVARPANDAGEAVHEPHEDAAREYSVRVDQGGFEYRAFSSHQAVDLLSER